MEKGRVGSDSWEDNSPLSPERKSKGDRRRCGKMERLEPGRGKPKDGAERGGERFREEVKPGGQERKRPGEGRKDGECQVRKPWS